MEAKKRSMPTPDVRCVSGRQFMMIGRLHAAATHAVSTHDDRQAAKRTQIRFQKKPKFGSKAFHEVLGVERLVFRYRTTSASTAPCTFRRMRCPTHCDSRHTRG